MRWILAENKNSKFAGTSNLMLSSRKNLSITGVKDVDRFDDKEIIAITNQGKLKINGANLKIGKLSVESGTLDLSGKINSLCYMDSRELTKNFFKNLFK